MHRLTISALLLALSAVPTWQAVLPSGVEIPTYATVCKRGDAEIDNCFRQSIQTVIKKIASKGIRGIQMPPLDPMTIPEVLGGFQGAGYNFKNIVRDITVKGFGKTAVMAVRSDLSDSDNMNLEIDYIVPHLDLSGNFKVDGLIANIPVGGKGPFTVNTTDVRGTLKVNGHLIEKDGVEYLRVHRVDMLPSIGSLQLNFENIVDGNKDLSDAANQFFNSYWLPVYEGLAPYTKDAIDKVLKYYINIASMKIPFDQLIPQ